MSLLTIDRRWTVVLALIPATALATPTIQDCSTTDAPPPWNTASCDGRCSQPVSVDKLFCYSDDGNLAHTGNTSAIIVSDYDGSGNNEYNAWGTDNGGALWCCSTIDSIDEIDEVNLIGSVRGDYLAGSFSTSDVENVDLFIITSSDGVDTSIASNEVETLITGGSDRDLIFGGDQADVLKGKGGDDEIYGNGGDDEIHGGSGDDVIEGNGGDDDIFGGRGEDVLNGNGGDDLVSGERDDDIVRGQAGNDILYGGSGADVICGGGTSGTGTDTLDATEPFVIEAPNDHDTLWSPDTANQPTGGGTLAGDDCGSTAHTSGWAGPNCSYTLPARPSECIQ